MHDTVPFVFCFLLFAVGVYAVTVKKNLVKVIIGVMIIHNAINLFFVLLGYRVPASGEAAAPIVTPALSGEEFLARTVDPVPQALVLTAIVIGFGLFAFAVTLVWRAWIALGTIEADDMREAEPRSEGGQ